MTLTAKTPAQTCLIEVRRGDRVVEKSGSQRTGKVVDFRLVPNGIDDPKLVCLVVVELDGFGRVISTSDKWEPISDDFYMECYPNRLLDICYEGEPAQETNGKKPIEIDNPISMIEV